MVISESRRIDGARKTCRKGKDRKSRPGDRVCVGRGERLEISDRWTSVSQSVRIHGFDMTNTKLDSQIITSTAKETSIPSVPRRDDGCILMSPVMYSLRKGLVSLNVISRIVEQQWLGNRFRPKLSSVCALDSVMHWGSCKESSQSN